MRHDEIANALRHAKYNLGSHADPHSILDHANDALDLYGVEVIRDRSGAVVASYVNTGETYDSTLIFDHLAERFCIESMGDFVERKERARPSRYGFRAA